MLLTVGLIVTGRVQAQKSKYYTPTLINYKPGSYQLLDGKWLTGELYTDSGDMVLVRSPTNKFTMQYESNELREFVLERDTFKVVRNVDISGHRQVSKAFAKQLYRRGDFVLLQYRHVMSPVADAMLGGPYTIGRPRRPALENSLLVQPRTGPVVRVPGTRRAFEEAMMPLFGDCPDVAEKIKAGKWGQQHMQNILLAYAQWQQSKTASPQLSSQ